MQHNRRTAQHEENRVLRKTMNFTQNTESKTKKNHINLLLQEIGVCFCKNKYIMYLILYLLRSGVCFRENYLIVRFQFSYKCHFHNIIDVGKKKTYYFRSITSPFALTRAQQMHSQIPTTLAHMFTKPKWFLEYFSWKTREIHLSSKTNNGCHTGLVCTF